jgi:hypothetical protein
MRDQAPVYLGQGNPGAGRLKRPEALSHGCIERLRLNVETKKRLNPTAENIGEAERNVGARDHAAALQAAETLS